MIEFNNEKYIAANGDIIWYKNGHYHREDGPAVQHVAGFKSWWINGKRHRLDGPAIIHANGEREWFLNHKKLPVKSQKEFEQYKKLMVFI
jgi:hypothetical protein